MKLRFQCFDNLASTNDQLMASARKGETEGLVVIARSQSKGRGRHHNSWISPQGNLYSSLLLTPAVSLERIPQLSLLCSLACAIALEQLGQRKVQIKWPNDILIGGRKVGGCLIETLQGDGGVPHVIVGLGINIMKKPPPVRNAWRASCLYEEGLPPFKAEFLANVLWQECLLWYELWLKEGFHSIRALWLARAFALGDVWICHHDGHNWQGVFKGIAEDGALLFMREGDSIPQIIYGARLMRVKETHDSLH